ncbi:MAG TPA: DUF4440 domain-containing protein [Candidatus Acidoferrales bacterium]|nr:DUF4440 domain-containing protein [Candidatus Acidoferrales bacterium]
MQISREDFEAVKELEESMWRSETRFDRDYMERVLSPDFFEFGRSGRVYKREDTLAAPAQKINAKLPLKDFRIHPITEDVVLVTYITEVIGNKLEMGNRSSIWIRTPKGWRLRFHQGTPVNS